MKKLLLALGLFLALASPAAAQNTTCSDRPPADSSNACANTRFVQSSLNALTLTIEQFGGGCSKADTVNATALTAAVNSTTGPVRVLFPQSCNYEITGNFVFNKTGVWIEGAQLGTRLKWNPTANGTFLKWAAPVAFTPLTYGGLKNITIWTPDQIYTKTMIESVAVSGFRIENVSCGYDPSFGGNVTVVTGGTGSTCYYPQGWELGWIQNFWFAADKPIRIGMNPYWSYAQDHFHWSNGYLIGTANIASFPLVTVDPGVAFSNTAFDHIAFVGGKDGFYNNDTGAINQVFGIPAAGSNYVVGEIITVTEAATVCPTAPRILVLSVSAGGHITAASVYNPGQCNSVANGSPWTQTSTTGVGTGAQISAQYNGSYTLTFDNIRVESGNGTPATNWSFYIKPTWGQTSGLRIANTVIDGGRNGIFLGGTINTKLSQISDFDGSATPVVALSATAANNNDMVQVDNSLWAPGVNLTTDLTGMCVVQSMASPTGTNTGIPPFALYSSTICSQTLAGLNVTGSLTATSAPLNLTGNISRTVWGLNGVLVKAVAGSVFTDTSSSGTVAAAVTSRFGDEVIAATSPTTFTDYYGVQFDDPVAGSNVTFTRKYAIGAGSGRIDRARIFTEDLGQNGLASGTLNVYGITSGVGTATAQAVMGTPAWTFPTNSGTFAVSATAPLAINATTGNITMTDPLPLANGGLAAALTASNGGIFYSTASAGAILGGTATARLPLLSGASTTPVWGAYTIPASVTSGGIPYFSSTSAQTSSALLTANGVVYGGGAGGAPASTAAGTNGQLFLGVTSGAPQWGSMSQDCTITNAGVITCTKTNNVAFATVATSASAADLSAGTLPAARMPALTGDCTTSAGAVATTCTKINGVDQTAAWTTYTPTITAATGTPTTTSATGRYRQIGKTVIAEMDITITSVGTASGGVRATLPITAAAFRYTGGVFEYAITGKSGAGYINGPSAPTLLQTSDATGTTWWVNGYNLAATVTYEVP
jgi:hypothetical protein